MLEIAHDFAQIELPCSGKNDPSGPMAPVILATASKG